MHGRWPRLRPNRTRCSDLCDLAPIPVTKPEAAGEALRFHPACPFAGQRTPALIALVGDVVTNEPKAIHRTALTLDGHKVGVGGKDRLALGPVAAGAVKMALSRFATKTGRSTAVARPK